MKITTQRSLLWTINFVIVFALIGCVALMAKKGGSFRNRDLIDYRKTVDLAANVKVPKQDQNDSSQAWSRFRTPLEKGFFFEGYVKPPEPEKRPDGPVAESAPDLKTLISVQMVLAPTEETGPLGDALGAASIKILSKKPGGAGGQADGIYTYEVGDIIGVDQDYRDDKDPMLEKWGPCRLLEVRDSVIVCSRNKDRSQVEVAIDLSPPKDTDVMVKLGKDNLYGSEAALHGKEEKDGVTLDTDKLTAVKVMNEITMVTWTPRGFEALEDEGEKLLDQVEVESEKGGGLKITSLPSRLSEFGIQPGDVITAIDGQEVKNKEAAVNYVRKTYKKKAYYGVTVLRDGKTRNLQVDVPRKLSDANKMSRNLRFGK